MLRIGKVPVVLFQPLGYSQPLEFNSRYYHGKLRLFTSFFFIKTNSEIIGNPVYCCSNVSS